MLRNKIRYRQRFRTGTMILRLRMTICTNTRIELNKIRRLIVFDVASRAAIGRHARCSRMISGDMLMQRACVTIEALFIAYPTEWLRMTRLTFNL
jgi:hypothetical protein